MMQSPSQCHDLARRLADLEPGLSDGETAGTPLEVVSRAVGVWNSRGYRRHQRHHGKYEPSKGYRMTTSEEHRPHEHADHVHGEGCGHEAVQHGDHVDYLHDEHRHAEHEGHYDEHGDA